MFPERIALSKNWHDPGVDVTMTMQIIEAYFDRAKKGTVTGKIDAYFLPKKNSADKDDRDREDGVEEGGDQEKDLDEDIGWEGWEDEDDDNYRGRDYDMEHIVNAGLFPLDREGDEEDEEEEDARLFQSEGEDEEGEEDLLSEREE
ncbi:hypothetical protein O988_00424 [Pseudogymnoascus sp. VKM F-3808]|nr:hypothetical protein O988_00424 [Pseudogymnoascus sp. VKM F-3808]